MYAAVNDHPFVVHALVVARADLNAKDTVRTTDIRTITISFRVTCCNGILPCSGGSPRL
jgi:hypothetical protein